MMEKIGNKPELTPQTKKLAEEIKDPVLKERLSFGSEYKPSELVDGFWQSLILAVLKLEKKAGEKS